MMNVLTGAIGNLNSMDYMQRAAAPSALLSPQGAAPSEHASDDSVSLSDNAMKALNGNSDEPGGQLNSLQNDWSLNPFDNFRKLRSAFQYNGKEGPDSFGQGQEGNCSTVAVTKAAMDAFGEGVFKKDDYDGATGAHSLELRDGTSLQISKDDYETAQKNSHFEGAGGKDEEFATLCYSAAAKNLMQTNGYKDMQQACDDLNDGFNPRESAKMLGLEGDMKNIDQSAITAAGVKEDELKKHDAIVGWSSGHHAIYIDNDQKEGLQSDHYGTPVKYDGTDTWENKYLTDAFAFR